MVNYKHTEERKRKIRESKLGTKNPNYGHNYGQCRKCGITHIPPMLGKRGISRPYNPAHLFGKQNPFYKNGLYTKEVQDFKKSHKICVRCGSTEKLDIHHLDGNRKNNALSNLTVLCRRCHMDVDERLREMVSRNQNEIFRQKVSERMLRRWRGGYCEAVDDMEVKG